MKIYQHKYTKRFINENDYNYLSTMEKNEMVLYKLSIESSNNNKLQTKKYHVESGEERWNYDSHIPLCEVIDYWVKLGDEKIITFAYYEQAIEYCNKLNNAIDAVNKTYGGKNEK